MPQPAFAASRSSDFTSEHEPLGSSAASDARRASPAVSSALLTHGASAEARSGGDDRGAGALKQAQRTVELLRGQVTKLEAAIGNRDFQTARWLAASLRTTAPGLRSSIEEARSRGADAAALAAVERRAVELSPRLEAALAQAPVSARGLGFDLLDPEGEERLEQEWLAQLEGAAARRDARGAKGATKTSARGAEGRADAALASAASPVTPRGYELIPTASPAKSLSARREEMLAAFQALHQQVAARLAGSRQLGVHTAGRAEYSAHVLGKPLEVRYHEAAAELNAMRLALAVDDIDGPRLEKLAERLTRLDFETALLAQIGSLGQMFGLLDELENDRWVLFIEGLTGGGGDEQTYFGERGGRIGRLEAMRRGASVLKSGLATLHSRWIKVAKLAEIVERGAASQRPLSTGAFTGLVQRAPARVLEQRFAEIHRLAATLGNDDNIRAFFKEALCTARNAQTRAMITQLAAMLGVLVATTALGAATGGLAMGAGAGRVATFFVGAATDSAVFTTLNARLNDDGLGAKLVTDFSANMATFGALRMVRGFVAASVVGKTLEAGSKAGRGAYLAAKVADFSATSLTAAASQFAIAEAQHLATHGRVLSEDELQQLAVQGLAMMIAGSLLHRGLLSASEELSAASARLGRRLWTPARMRAIAARLAAHPDPVETDRLNQETRAYLDERLALSREPASKSPEAPPTRAGAAAPADAAQPTDAAKRLGEVHVTQLRRLRDEYLARPNTTTSDFTYDKKTRTVSFEIEVNGARGRVEAKLPRPITKLSDWAKPNRIIGTKTLPSEAAAADILRRVSAGDLDALRQLGTEVPKDLAARMQQGLEFGLGELPNGEFVIVRGNKGEVDWHGTLPGVIGRGHVHPSTSDNHLPPDATGQQRISLETLLTPSPDPLLARELIFPSTEDIEYTAANKVNDHRVFTPYIVKDGHVMKPPAGHSATERLEILIRNASDTGRRSEDGMPIYRAELALHFGNAEAARAEVFAVPLDPSRKAKIGGIYMQFPEGK